MQRHGHDLHQLIQHLGIVNPILVGQSKGASTIFSFLNQYGEDNISAVIDVDQTPKILNDVDWKHGMNNSENIDFEHYLDMISLLLFIKECHSVSSFAYCCCIENSLNSILQQPSHCSWIMSNLTGVRFWKNWLFLFSSSLARKVLCGPLVMLKQLRNYAVNGKLTSSNKLDMLSTWSSPRQAIRQFCVLSAVYKSIDFGHVFHVS